MRSTLTLLVVLLTTAPAGAQWAFEETFDGLDPAAPSQALLPDHFDFVATHRTHPRDHEPGFDPFPADHGPDCAGPAPPNPAQHPVVTSHGSNGADPDESFFICRQHMMSSMGHVEGYSVSAFWTRQEFDFADGGVLEFDVNINDGHSRSWWEVLIAPREQMKIGAAREWLPISETYPRERIVLDFSPGSRRSIAVGSGDVAPGGWLVDDGDWRDWRVIDPADPALDDRRIRRRMRVELSADRIDWSIEKEDGSFDTWGVTVTGGLPFDRGVVLFKTHAYTPNNDDNFDQFTFHWDNLRFDGPVTGRWESFEATGLVYLEANGNRPIGDNETATIDLPHLGSLPVLAGQLHGAMNGQVLLSVNGGANRVVHPIDYSVDGGDPPECGQSGWASFRLPLDPGELVAGTNEFRWTVGPRPACASNWWWDGFTVKALEVQFELDAPLFEDGFESGDTTAWSTTVP